MDVLLHIGAHRTATTSFQTWMEAHAPRGIGFLGPKGLRPDAMAGLIGRADMVTRDDIAQAGRTAAGLRARFADAAARGQSRLILSEENCLGGLPHLMASGRLYPDAGARVARVLEGLGAGVSAVALTIRPLEAWWSSVLSVERARGGAAPLPERLDRIAARHRGWADVIEDVARVIAPLPLIVSRFEHICGRPRVQLAHWGIGGTLAGQVTATEGAADPACRHLNAAVLPPDCLTACAPHGAAPGGRRSSRGSGEAPGMTPAPAPAKTLAYRPFAPAQAEVLALRDLNDLDRLRAGPANLIFVETDVAEPGGVSPAASIEEGPFHDQHQA